MKKAAVVLAACLICATVLAQDKPAPEKRGSVELMFVLDTTGSMGGLIHGAKQKIWAIVNHVAAGEPTPDIKVGLVATSILALALLVVSLAEVQAPGERFAAPADELSSLSGRLPTWRSAVPIAVEHPVRGAVLETVAVELLGADLHEQVFAPETHVGTEVIDRERHTQRPVEQLGVVVGSQIERHSSAGKLENRLADRLDIHSGGETV